MNLAAEWCPLNNHSLVAILHVSLPDDLPGTDMENGDSWEADDTPAILIVHLDISFSSVNLPCLSRSLFEEGLLRAPGLTTLRIDHTTQIHISNALLSLLAGLPLINLSLAAQSLAPGLLPTLALPRLASSTPSLEVLDLSFNPTWAGLSDDRSKPDGISRELGLGAIDWKLKWTNLGQLSLIGNFALSHPAQATSQVIVAKKPDHTLRLLRKLMKPRLESGGRWIECLF